MSHFLPMQRIWQNIVVSMNLILHIFYFCLINNKLNSIKKPKSRFEMFRIANVNIWIQQLKVYALTARQLHTVLVDRLVGRSVVRSFGRSELWMWGTDNTNVSITSVWMCTSTYANQLHASQVFWSFDSNLAHREMLKVCFVFIANKKKHKEIIAKITVRKSLYEFK